MFVCVCLCVSVCALMCLWVWRSYIGVCYLPQLLSYYFLRQGLLLELGLRDLVRITCQQVPGVSSLRDGTCVVSLTLYSGVVDLNSHPHDNVVRTLLIELSPQPLTQTIQQPFLLVCLSNYAYFPSTGVYMALLACLCPSSGSRQPSSSPLPAPLACEVFSEIWVPLFSRLGVGTISGSF